MQNRIPEVDLDHAFAEALEASRNMQGWLLSGGRFSRCADSARLMNIEQAAARKANHWWKHWWTRMPDGTEGETDIFLVFETPVSERFAIHIENKPPHGKLTLEQAVAYRKRAALKANSPKWLDYTDFEVLLLAPSTFAKSNAEAALQFDRTLFYEDVAQFVPLFSEAISTA